jgi:multimeric flavodoxin WrbA
MKKIFAFIGSPMKDKSCTNSFAQQILAAAAARYDGELHYEVVTAGDINLLPCRGCCNCFRTCECVQDSLDDMADIRQKMIEADFIIWGSPVYAHQVTGQMKIYIDRISYWFHLLRLAGKEGIILSTSSGSGYMEVLTYLAKLMYNLGMKPIGAYNVYTMLQGEFLDQADVVRKVEKISALICEHLQNDQVTGNKQLEKIFWTNKQSIIACRDIKPGEYEFWEVVNIL